MNKKIILLVALILNAQYLRSSSLDGTMGTSVYKSSQWAFSGGDYARGFVCLNAGFSVASGTVNFNVLQPVSGNIDLGGSGAILLEGDLWLGSNVTITQGGSIDGQGNTIFLNGDLTIPAGTEIKFLSDTIIDGQGHDIVFEDEAYFLIDGASGTQVTLRNCNVKGILNYTSDNSSIMFGDSSQQKLVLNDVNLYLAADYYFYGGALDIVNSVAIKSFDCIFYYNSGYDLTIKSDSTLLLDMNLIFIYGPSDNSRYRLVMESKTSTLFLNGCYFYQNDQCGLELSNGHLVIDHFVGLSNLGADKKSWGLYLGNNVRDSNLVIDILPAATMDVTSGGLYYNNVDNIVY